MFVNRKPSRIRPGRRNTQIYVPHKQMQIVQPPLEIRTKNEAEFYYNELQRLGYITPPIDNPNNALDSIVTSSDGTFLEFTVNDNVIFTGDAIDPEAIDPPPVRGQTYDIKLLGGLVIPMVTIDGQQHQWWTSSFEQYYPNEALYAGQEQQTAASLQAYADEVFYTDVKQYDDDGVEVIGTFKCVGFSHRQAKTVDLFPCDQWRIDLSPAQTFINILLRPVLPE